MAVQSEGSESGRSSKAAVDEDHRERRLWWTIASIGFVAFIGVIMLGRPLVEGRLTAARNLDRATAMIAGTDGALAAIDGAVRAAPATGTATVNAGTLLKARDTRKALEEASLLSQNGFERLTGDEQKRAAIVKTMTTARIEALHAAEVVLSIGGEDGTAPSRERALEEYGRAVEKVRQADAALVRL